MCSKYKQELEGLEKAPFPGPLGKKIFENVSNKAWVEWKEDIQIKVLNEYRINVGDPEGHKMLMEQMQLYLGLKDGTVKEVENAERGKS